MSRNQRLKSVPMMKGVYELGLTGWGGPRLCRLWLWRRRREEAADWMTRILRFQIRSARRKALIRKAVRWVKTGWRP